MADAPDPLPPTAGLTDPRPEANPYRDLESPLARPMRRVKQRKSRRTKLDTDSAGGQTGPIGRERGGGRGGQH